MKMRREINRLLKQGAYVELEIMSNTFAYVMFKSDKFDMPIKEEFNEYGEVKYIDLQVAKEMINHFKNKWLIITDVCIIDKKLDDDDKEMIKSIKLKDIYDYLNISKYYQFDDNGNVMVHDLEYYHDLLLSMPLEEFKKALNCMNNKADRVQLWEIAIKLHEQGIFSDINKINVLEQAFDKIDRFVIG